MRQRREGSQATDFDPAEWLERAEAYGYRINLVADHAGKLGLSIGQPREHPPNVRDPIYGLNELDDNYWVLHRHLLQIGRVSRIPRDPIEKSILRHMKRLGLLPRRSKEMATLKTCDVLKAAGERGLIYMCTGMVPPSLHDEGRTER